MDIRYNVNRDEFSGNFFGWSRDCVLNHELFGKQLGFGKVTRWTNKAKPNRTLTIGIKRHESSKNGLVMVHLVGPDNVPRMQMLCADCTSQKEVESVATTMVSSLLYTLGVPHNRTYLEFDDDGEEEVTEETRQKHWEEFNEKKLYQDERILSVGFYDWNSDWFFKYDSRRPGEDFDQDGAHGVQGDYIVRFYYNGYKECTLGAILENGMDYVGRE